ncbi:polysaccharide biosynthesis/export family protein [Sandarakinorhabdus oryzae]|uniref:polysaccharide biosynthesis/export family protein n=1 Tax=Sandarakinorhabdus oryzae TaxID=2675220 RepID=UPI0012E20371|nr:polysaccharide biosynthesis/export family protein [Sandarakinorhabdus oryzae]
MKQLLKAAALSVLMAGTALAQNAEYKGYTLGPDDTVQVIVYGQSEFNVTTRIKADGTIVMPLIGIVQAGGQTNITLAKEITDKLVASGFLKQPLVNIEVGSYVSRSVNVAGNVGAAGIIPLDRPYHALEALLKAGWVRNDGANFVYLRRQGQPERKLDVEQLVRGDANADPLLQPGDTLFVPPAETFFIYGQINSPGMKAILPGMTIRQAIGLSGGVSPSGKADKVGLVRGNGKEVDADPSMKVQNGDVIIIKERLF